MTENNKAILETANQAVVNGDNETFLTYCTEDVIWNFVGDITLKGKQQVRDYMNETYIEPPKFDVKNTIAQKEYVTAIGKIALKDRTGKTTQYEYCDIWRFQNGKMAELTAFVIEIK